MKRLLLSAIIIFCSIITKAQTDTTGTGNNGDTVHVGNFIIIRNHREGNTNYDSVPPRRDNFSILRISRDRYKEQKQLPNRTITTNYFVFDLGFANYHDKTDYSSQDAQSFLHAPVGGPAFQKNDLKLITGKSSNVNIWLFMQKLNVEKRVVNFKYALGLEMFNLRYKNNISYNANPAYIYRDTIDFSKNKLFVSYLTVPFMLNLNATPNKKDGFSISAGVSAGYRIGSHTKQKSDELGKVKDHNDFDLAPWRFAYVAELGLGPVRLYGSYSIKSMFDHSLNQYPYTIGLRFSN